MTTFKRHLADKRLLAAVGGLVLVLAAVLPGWLTPRPAPRYTVTDFGVLPGYAESSASAVNSSREAACRAAPIGPRGSWGQTRGRAFLSQTGRLTDLGALPGTNGSDAQGVNAKGEVTGSADLPGARRAFLYRGGRLRDLGAPPGYTDSAGAGINDRSEVAIDATNSAARPGQSRGRAFLYSRGRMVSLPLPPGCRESHAGGISAAGRVVGDCRLGAGRARREYPFVYDGRTKALTVLPVPAPYWCFSVCRVNDHAQVLGNVMAADNSFHAALWQGNRMTDLGAPPGYDNSKAEGLNGRGEAVGRCWHSSGFVEVYLWSHTNGGNVLGRYLDRDKGHAFVYQGGRMQDLNELIPRSAGWTLEAARDINDRGQIVGYGQHHGRQRAFLLTPIR